MTDPSFPFAQEAATFYSNAEVGVTIHDPATGKLCYANEWAETLTGYGSETLRNLDLTELNPDSVSSTTFIEQLQAAADGEPQQLEWRLKRPSGEIIWIEMRLSALALGGDTYTLALIRDISEYKMDLRHLRLLNRIVSHNFRNKLQIVQGSSRQLTGDNNAAILNRMRRAIADLVDLTNWVNALTSLSRGQKDTKINVCTLLTNRLEKYRTEYPEINWELDCENVYIEADTPIQRAFDELIDNAVRHNEHEDLDITVSASENMADQQIDIQIIDTGTPIPDIEIQPLMDGYEPDPLEHEENIGLWEVQTIINSHQGILTLKENSSELKIIEVTLPLADPK
jgi:PAS domain S-box-containing protein